VTHALTEEISDKEVVLTPRRENQPPAVAGPLTLTIPALGLVQVPANSSRLENSLTLHFERLSIAQERALIALLYCRPGQWTERGVAESLTLWHFFEAMFRMYPLAEAK
jgi:cellulose synthase (UDP-forming)